MTQSSLYLYCLARAAAVRNFAIEGLDGGLVTSLEVRELAALVSEVPLREFEEAATAGLSQDPAWIIPRATVMSKSSRPRWSGPPCCQFALAHVLKLSSMEDFVVAHYDQIAGFLDWVADKEEWSVKACATSRLQASGPFRRTPI